MRAEGRLISRSLRQRAKQARAGIGSSSALNDPAYGADFDGHEPDDLLQIVEHVNRDRKPFDVFR